MKCESFRFAESQAKFEMSELYAVPGVGSAFNGKGFFVLCR
jgi:hypothetical protein